MLVHSSSMAVRSCWILAGTGTRCRIWRSRASQTCSMGDMSGEYAGHPRTGMFSASRNCVQILATWGCALSCCNMRWWSWMNGTTMGPISSRYLCAFKMPSMSITYTCPYHNPTATMGHSIRNIDIMKPLTHTMSCTLSAIWPVQWKPWFIREKNISPKCQTPSNVSICPLKSVKTTNCSQVKTLMRKTSMQMSFPQTVSDSLCRNSLVMQTDCCSSCPGGWSQTILEVKMLAVEVLGWCGYMWSAVVRLVGCTAKFSEMLLETTYGREMNIQFTGNSSGGHSCSQHANCDICDIVLCDKTAHFRVAFYCGQPKAHLCNNHAV